MISSIQNGVVSSSNPIIHQAHASAQGDVRRQALQMYIELIGLFDDDPYKNKGRILTLKNELQNLFNSHQDEFSPYSRYDISHFLPAVNSFYSPSKADSNPHRLISGEVSGWGWAVHTDLKQQSFPPVSPLKPGIENAPKYVQYVYQMNKDLQDNNIEDAKQVYYKLNSMDLKSLPELYQEKIQSLLDSFNFYVTPPQSIETLHLVQSSAESALYTVYTSRIKE